MINLQQIAEVLSAIFMLKKNKFYYIDSGCILYCLKFNKYLLPYILQNISCKFSNSFKSECRNRNKKRKTNKKRRSLL